MDIPIIIPCCAPALTDTAPPNIPIGRIDYLGSNGRVKEEAEYAVLEAFKREIAECDDIGIPICAVFYQDMNGASVKTDFLGELCCSSTHITYEPNPYRGKALLDTAKKFISKYIHEEFPKSEGPDFSNLSAIPVAYTTTEDDKYDIQAIVNLEALETVTHLNNKPAVIVKYPDLLTFVWCGLRNLDFNELTYVPDEIIQQIKN